MPKKISRYLCLHAIAIAVIASAGACDEETRQDDWLAPTAVSDPSVVTPAALGLGEDWIPAGERGLWMLVDDQGERKFLGIGEAGKAHAIANLAEVEEELAASLAEHDDDHTREQLGGVRSFIAAVGEEPASDVDETPTLRCSFDVSAFVDAKPVPCGVAGLATASFAHPCGSTKGTVQTFASATCGYSTKTHQCGPVTAGPVACTSSTSITGAGVCSSHAFAKITAPTVSLYVWDDNNIRGACGGGTTTSGYPYPNPCPGVNVECVAH